MSNQILGLQTEDLSEYLNIYDGNNENQKKKIF